MRTIYCTDVKPPLDSCDHERTERLTYAKELLFYFVVNAADLYGETFTIYNVHNLIHLSDDVTHFHTSLDSISCFPFENHLQVLKNLVHGSQNPIVQLVKRGV